MYRSGGSYPPLLSSVGGRASLSVLVYACTEYIKHQKENVPPNFFMGAIPPLPFPMSHAVTDLYIGGLGGSQLPVGIHFFLLFFLFNFNSTVHPTAIHNPLECQPPTRWRRAIDPPLLYLYVVVYVETCSVWTVVG